ncbi:hypothetical protein, variant 1 [Phytophthora nicotianae P1569]|uniref:Uncharacterized protein n=1 Tax=Phytophthora nicotianae P1569 TaxID=1317065 RepID=V9EE11_PHYNI|nr:hypothetical protein, variant 1 [Phytophthora nicotianae P1569]
MWSRLTEGLADIVAPEDGDEQDREDKDQLWSRFAAVVAPPPPSSPSATAVVAEEDEQEQYISELERALLQRKKQNETLEAKILELETRAGEERQLKTQLKQQEVEIAQQKATIERLQAARHDAVVQSEEGSDAGSHHDRLVQELQHAQTQVEVLATQCQAHEKELILLRDRIEELQAANETLQDDEREARSRAAEYEQGYMDLLTEIEKIKISNEVEKAALMAKSEEHASSIDSQKLYDLEARLTTSEADKIVAQQDAERLQRDLDALEDVLHQFQVASKAQKERVAAMEVELEQAKKELQTRQPLPEPTEGEANDLKRVMEKLAKKTHECEQLREALESTATQYNSERDVLDKRLAAQLVVAYVDSNKKGEVLQLMARMMVRLFLVYIFFIFYFIVTTTWNLFDRALRRSKSGELVWVIQLKVMVVGDSSRLLSDL